MCDIFKNLNDKIDILKMRINIVHCLKSDKTASMRVIEEIGKVKENISRSLLELQQIIAERKHLYEKQQVLEGEIIHLNYEFDQIYKNIKYLNPINYNDINFEELQETDSNSAEISEGNDTDVVPFQDFSPMVCTEIPRVTLRPKSLTFGLTYLTEEEFKEVPKYMLGRLTLDAINSFIDFVNDAFTRKYDILSKSRQTLKSDEMKLYHRYKALQTNELKGKRFITEEDIALEYNKVILDKKSYNLLTILRHSKKLLRIMSHRTAIYINNSTD